MLIFFRQKVKTTRLELEVNLKPAETLQTLCFSDICSVSVAHGKSHTLRLKDELLDSVGAYFFLYKIW